MELKFSAVVMEPDPIQRDLMRLALLNLQCNTYATTDAAVARRQLMVMRPDVLIIDTFLPKVNGIELLRSFRTGQLLNDTRVIVVSAMGFEEVVEQVAQFSVSTCLAKPLDMGLFSSRVKTLLDNRPIRPIKRA
jgi:DNA-binding response OmpR family regulator